MDNTEYQVKVETLMQDIEGDIITEGEALEALEEVLCTNVHNHKVTTRDDVTTTNGDE